MIKITNHSNSMQMKNVLNTFKFIFIIALFGLIFSGCASTKVTSYVNPEMVNHQCDNVLIEARTVGLTKQKGIEDAFYEDLSECGFPSIRSYDIFFPGREYSEAEKKKIYRDNKVDAILTAKICDAGKTKSYQSFTNYYKIGNITTAFSFGGTSSNPWIEFEAKLYDAQSGEVIWVAGATTKGSGYSSFLNLANSMSNSTVYQLIKDGRLKDIKLSPPPQKRRGFKY